MVGAEGNSSQSFIALKMLLLLCIHIGSDMAGTERKITRA